MEGRIRALAARAASLLAAWEVTRSVNASDNLASVEQAPAPSATNNASNPSLAEQLEFDPSRSVRISNIVLASFNSAAALTTVTFILLMSYRVAKRNNARAGFSLASSISAEDVFPAILSVGIFVQGIALAVAQSQGLADFYGNGCESVAQVLLPSLFLVPCIQLVFALETASRGLRSRPFQPRGRWNVRVCLAIIAAILIISLLVAVSDTAPDNCFKSLYWMVEHYAGGLFSVFLIISVALIACAIIIFTKLHRSTRIDVTERVAASRMVYHLALAVIGNTLCLPFLFSVAFVNPTTQFAANLTLGMIATVATNVTGMINGSLYIFLKTNTITTFGPSDKIAEYENRRLKHQISVRRAKENVLGKTENGFALQPVGSRSPLHRMDSKASLLSHRSANEKEMEAGFSIQGRMSPIAARAPSPTYYSRDQVSPKPANSAIPTKLVIPRAPEPVQISVVAPTPVARRQSSVYAALPSLVDRPTPRTPDVVNTVTLLPATTYSPGSRSPISASRSKLPSPVSSGKTDIPIRIATVDDDADDLEPPPSLFTFPKGPRHRRDSSVQSSATVQIGIRFSSANDLPPRAGINTNSVFDIKNDYVADPGLAIPLPANPFLSPASAAMVTKQPEAITSRATPTPLSQLVVPTGDNLGQDSSVNNSNDDDVPDVSPTRDARMKTLPPAPKTPPPIRRDTFLPAAKPTTTSAVSSPQKPKSPVIPRNTLPPLPREVSEVRGDDTDIAPEKQLETLQEEEKEEPTLTLSPAVYDPNSPTKAKQAGSPTLAAASTGDDAAFILPSSRYDGGNLARTPSGSRPAGPRRQRTKDWV